MDDWKTRIKDLLEEFQYKYILEAWSGRLIAAGINQDEALMWAVEIGQVVEEFQDKLVDLADILEETDIERIPEQIATWASGVSVVAVEEIQIPMRKLEASLKKYLPPDPDDEDEAT